MSILEQFVILFSSDADEVDKGAKKAEKSTDDLEKKINSADKSATKLGANFLSTAKVAAAGLAAIFSVGAVMSATIASINYADALKETSDALGVNMQDWEAWTRAAKIAGGSAQGLQSSVNSLNRNLAQIATNGNSRILPYLQRFGISIRDANGDVKTGLDLLPELAAAFEGLSKQEIQGIGTALGLDSGTIMLLQQGRKEIDEMIRKQKELGTVREKDAIAAERYNDALDYLGMSLRVLLTRIAGFVLPGITAMINGFTKLTTIVLNNGREFMVFGGLVTAALTYMALPAILAATKAVIGLGIALLATPIGWFALGFAALAVILADVWAYFQGAPSVLGDLVAAFDGAGEKIIAIFKRIGEFINQTVAFIMERIGEMANALSFGAFGRLGELMRTGTGAIASAESYPMAGISSAAISAGATNNRNTNVSVGEVNIQTQATDVAGIQSAIGKGLRDELSQTAANFDDGIRG